MGGSGGGSTRYTRPIKSDKSSGGKSGASSSDDCDKIHFKAQLQNIQPALAKHHVGDVLELELNNDEVLAVSANGVCGSIINLHSFRLIDCLKKGKKFKAVIEELNTLICTGIVRPLR